MERFFGRSFLSGGSLKVARSSYFPTLSLGAGLPSNYSKDGMGSYYDQVQNNLGRSMAFFLSIPIFSRFQVINNVARAKLNVLDAEQVAHYKESFRIAEVRFNAGAINSVDFLFAKNKMDNANANLVIARYQWHLRQRIVDYYNGELLVGETE